MTIRLRAVEPDDLPTFFANQTDPEANQMAAFTAPDPSDRAAFDAFWRRILQNETIVIRTIVVDDAGEVAGDGERVAGNVSIYEEEGRREVTYWIGRSFWGRGVATEALALFLQEIDTRPLYARAAADNIASLRVLEKNGFAIVAAERGFANARAAEIDEYVLRLD